MMIISQYISIYIPIFYLKMKQSYNTHDIYALVTELKSWIGWRVLNVYDIDSKTICIKFNSDKSEKKYLIIESGTKFYTLDNFSATKDFPSSFSSKLRKHINNKRLESFVQVNTDRVIDIQFGTNEFEYHIIGEFYASGNIIFTDHQYNILTLVHPHTYTNGTNSNKTEENTNNQIRVCVGQKYPFDIATSNIELSSSSIKNMFESNLKLIDKKIKLKQFVCKLPLIKYSPNVIEHALLSVGMNSLEKISSQTRFEDLFESEEKVNNFIKIINNMFELDKFEGYKTVDNIYPFPYKHIELLNSIKFDNFTSCSSIFWSELKPIETKEQIKKKDNLIKLSKQEKAIWNIEQQIKGMENNINFIIEQIDILTENIDLIQDIIDYVKNESLIQLTCYLSTSYLSINKAKLIAIFHNKIVKIELENNTFEINYNISPWENREILYKKMKKIQEKKSNALEILNKHKRTLEKSNYIKKDLLDQNTQSSQSSQIAIPNNLTKYKILGQTKSNWFEQFNWFFTSDNLLFISGKTADQNEQIVKKYMESQDIYIHSEVFGSGSGIIKNPSNLTNIPELYPSSLIEAGTFLIAHTKAWGTGSADSAYWVKPEQVSKTPESGEYLTKGSFIIRGQKNLIRVDKMEMGFGILFKTTSSDNFISNPTNTDQIEYAIPVLSTYSSIFEYKFKVKVIGGNQKIKKILPEVISNFHKKANIYEKEAIKKISNDSIQKVLINGIRFVLSK